ncbi:hypothetical protein HMPREF1549_00863 [Actinomyces johnsonii F0510]|uniref:Uncharacterized protein n=1 Tax=Actinomyces johnsonii F0510 TaxID=1227262 RepID=U1QGR4_9ACTO|nr:hypothetical protein HMPREF1549_00863 [Actinomyces johnsonii F0510]
MVIVIPPCILRRACARGAVGADYVAAMNHAGAVGVPQGTKNLPEPSH